MFDPMIFFCSFGMLEKTRTEKKGEKQTMFDDDNAFFFVVVVGGKQKFQLSITRWTTVIGRKKNICKNKQNLFWKSNLFGLFCFCSFLSTTNIKYRFGKWEKEKIDFFVWLKSEILSFSLSFFQYNIVSMSSFRFNFLCLVWFVCLLYCKRFFVFGSIVGNGCSIYFGEKEKELSDWDVIEIDSLDLIEFFFFFFFFFGFLCLFHW